MENLKLLSEYQNGNYTVKIYDDGTKIRETEADEFLPEFPENIDIKISDKCDLGCAFCHENSTIDGENAKFDQEFLWSLREGTELAIGGGNVFENEQLIDFLSFCKGRGIIANLTVNQGHAFNIRKFSDTEYINSELEGLHDRGLLNGVGISYNGDAEGLLKFYNHANEIDKYSWRSRTVLNSNNFVIHVINGVHSFEDIMKLANKDIKILILGYKDVRRGEIFRMTEDESIKRNQKSIYDNIHTIINSFKVVSFDNLALEQLDIKRLLTTEEWNEFYMGDEGSMTFYIDLVKQEFAINSSEVSNRFQILSSVENMFEVVKNERSKLLKG